MKKNWFYIANLCVFLLLYIIIEVMTPKPVNWKPSYSTIEKAPLGLYVLYRTLESVFPGRKINRIYESPWSAFRQKKISIGNYIIINTDFSADRYDITSLNSHVSQGGFCFIAAHSFSAEAEKKFGIKTSSSYNNKKNAKYSLMLNRKNTSVKKYNFNTSATDYHFSTYPNTAVIVGRDAKNKPNLIKISREKGWFFLSAVPEAFTNNAILYGKNEDYAFTCLSFLPVHDVYVDEFFTAAGRGQGSPIQVILSDDSLKSAYYVSMVLLILFILVKARRRQHIIPVIEAPRNESLIFIEMVGKLYFNRGDNKDLALKKILYFNEYMRSHFTVTMTEQSDAAKIAARTGAELKDILALYDLWNKIASEKKIGDKDLITLDTLIYSITKTIQKEKRA